MGQQFLLFGLGQITDNFGCEALVHGTGVILKRMFPDCIPIYVSDGHAASDRDRLGVSSLVVVADGAPRWGARFIARRIMSRRFHCALAGIGTCTPTIVVISTAKGRKITEDVYDNDLDYSINLRDFNRRAIKIKSNGS